MNMQPFVKSKLIAPEIPQKILYSERIRNFSIESKRVTIITAPAGFGKTTTVLLSLKNHRHCMRWYRLEKEDAFLQVFYSHLIETLFSGTGITDLECRRVLSGVSNLSEEYPLVNAQICQDAAQIVHNAKKLFLVFDDFHNVAENRAIVESLRYFTTNLPDFISIIITSRVEAGILSGKLAIDRNMLFLTEKELRFTKEEAEKLVLSVYKLPFSENEAAEIHERSEGWITGIYIICHNRSMPPSGKTDTELDDGLFRRYFMEFYLELEESKRDILIKLSILPDFSSEEIELFGYTEPYELLDWLEKSNLYIQKMNATPVRFRFHSLFRQELEDVLSKTLPQNELRNLYVRAAGFYEKTGNKALSIRLLLHIGRVESAAAIAREKCIRDFNTGHLENMGEMITCFPDEVILQCPYLTFFKSITYQNINHEINFNYAMSALKAFSRTGDVSFLMNVFGMILIITFQTNNFEKLKEAASYLPVAKIVLKGGNPLKKLLVSAASGMVADEKFKSGSILFKILDYVKVSDPVWNYSRLMVRSILLYRRGRLGQSNDNLRDILNNPVGLFSEQLRITGYVSGHLALCLSMDIKFAETAMDEFASLAEKYGSFFAKGFTYRMAAFISYQSNDMAGAIENIQKSIESFDISGSPVLAYTSAITKYFWQSERDDASELAAKSLATLGEMDRYDVGHGFRELCQTMTAALLIKSQRYDEAEKMLLQSLKISSSKKAMQSISGTLIQLSELYYSHGELAKSKKYIKRWASLSSRNGYVFFWESDRPSLARACATAIQCGFNVKHILRIIEQRFGKAAAEVVKNDPALIANNPEMLFSNLFIESAGKKTVCIKLLGEFRISADNFVITDDNFKTRKISGVLKYILANNGKTISREALAGVFWPESEPKSAFMSLRVALCELRKVLASSGLSFDSSEALICESKNGFFTGDGNHLVFDTDEYLELYKRYQSFNTPKDEKTDILQTMFSMYDGGLLCDSLYDDWLIVQRERYCSIFIEISHALAKHLYDTGEYDSAESILTRHLTIEPLDETACSLLLGIFNKTGRESRALVVRKQFEKRFFDEMGIKPQLYEEAFNASNAT